jgi:hypothetical protein
VLLLEDGCLLHASTLCSKRLQVRQQQLCPPASLLEKLEPPKKAVHGSVQSPNGAGKTLSGQPRCLRACSARQCQPQKLPRRNHIRFSGRNSPIMVAPENEGGLLRSPELSALESRSFARSAKTLLFRLTCCEGHQ